MNRERLPIVVGAIAPTNKWVPMSVFGEAPPLPRETYAIVVGAIALDRPALPIVRVFCDCPLALPLV